VDVAAVQPAEVRAPVAVYDGLVEEVSVAPFSQGTGEGSTRVDVSLAADAEYKVLPAADGLSIRIEPVGLRAATPMSGSAQPMPPAVDGGAWPVTPMADAGAPAPKAATGSPARRLTAVNVRKVAGGVVLELRADGAIESAGSFTLEHPDRLVIDLPGLRSDVH